MLLRFRQHKVALTTDVSRMYRAVLLPENQRDLHRFVWRRAPSDVLTDYRMTRLTFGVSASSFAANMAVKQNAIEHRNVYARAAEVVHTSFYVDDGLTGANSVSEAADLQRELQELFVRGGFLLRCKWRTSEVAALAHLPSELVESSRCQELPVANEFAKVLGLEWSPGQDSFRLTMSDLPSVAILTKRSLTSDIARIFDVLGWFSPAIIQLKILLQRLWETKIDWDDPVPNDIEDTW